MTTPIIDPLYPYKVLGVLLLAVALSIGLYFGVSTILSWRTAANANAQTVHEQATTAEAATDIGAAATQQNAEAQRLDIHVSQGRQEYVQQYQNLKATDIGVAEWSAQPVPQRLRDLARSRRAARDGSGGGEAGSSLDGAEEGSQR
jgi:hypothetical protein